MHENAAIRPHIAWAAGGDALGELGREVWQRSLVDVGEAHMFQATRVQQAVVRHLEHTVAVKEDIGWLKAVMVDIARVQECQGPR